MSRTFHHVEARLSYLFQPLQLHIVLTLEMDADSHRLNPGIVCVPWVIHIPFIHLGASTGVSYLIQLWGPDSPGHGGRAQIHREGLLGQGLNLAGCSIP